MSERALGRLMVAALVATACLHELYHLIQKRLKAKP